MPVRDGLGPVSVLPSYRAFPGWPGPGEVGCSGQVSASWKGGTERRRGAVGEDPGVRVDVETFPKGRKTGLSPRCYCLAFPNLFNPPSGELGERNTSTKRTPKPSILPADRSHRSSQMQPQLPIQAASQALSA